MSTVALERQRPGLGHIRRLQLVTVRVDPSLHRAHVEGAQIGVLLRGEYLLAVDVHPDVVVGRRHVQVGVPRRRDARSLGTRSCRCPTCRRRRRCSCCRRARRRRRRAGCTARPPTACRASARAPPWRARRSPTATSMSFPRRCRGTRRRGASSCDFWRTSHCSRWLVDGEPGAGFALAPRRRSDQFSRADQHLPSSTSRWARRSVALMIGRPCAREMGRSARCERASRDLDALVTMGSYSPLPGPNVGRRCCG